MKRKVKRPSTTPSLTRNMDSQSLIGHTMKVQQWLNDKTLKTLQVRQTKIFFIQMNVFTVNLEIFAIIVLANTTGCRTESKV